MAILADTSSLAEICLIHDRDRIGVRGDGAGYLLQMLRSSDSSARMAECVDASWPSFLTTALVVR